jgi:hypothetical protein
MTQSITIVLVRLFAAYCMLTAFTHSWQIMAMIQQASSDNQAALAGANLPWVTMGILGALLWWFSIPVTRWVSDSPTALEGKVSADDMVAAGSFVIGLYWVVDALPQAISLTISLFQTAPYLGPVSSNFYVMEFMPVWAQAIIGLFIMVGCRNLARIFRSMRPNVSD